MGIFEDAFYIHGVMPERSGVSHEDTYNELHKGISDFLPSEPWPTQKGGAEWGWQPKETKRDSHRALAAAQNVFGGKVLEALGNASDYTLNPARLAVDGMRKTMMYGFGDMFYYVSTEGKWAVRNAVAEQLKQHIQASLPADEALSLTLLGHSAGSVIAFDLLYYLFMGKSAFQQRSWLTERGELSKQSAEITETELESLMMNFDYLHELIENGRFRLRMLVTFGSPISMLMYRSDKLVELFASGDNLTPDLYGLTSEIINHTLTWNTPRWLNIWDKDDPISWPISPVMGNHRLVKDEYIDVSGSVVKAHNQYWKNKKVQQSIAKYWKALDQ